MHVQRISFYSMPKLEGARDHEVLSWLRSTCHHPRSRREFVLRILYQYLWELTFVTSYIRHGVKSSELLQCNDCPITIYVS